MQPTAKGPEDDRVGGLEAAVEPEEEKLPGSSLGSPEPKEQAADADRDALQQGERPRQAEAPRAGAGRMSMAALLLLVRRALGLGLPSPGRWVAEAGGRGREGSSMGYSQERPLPL